MDSTTERAHRDNDSRLAEAFRELESAICDIHAMAIVLETVREDALDLAAAEKHPGMFTYTLTSEQNTALTFAVYHVGDLARKLHEKYYAGWPAPSGTSQKSGPR